MKIVVIGGTGLIGSKLVKKLGEHGHEAVAALVIATRVGEGFSGCTYCLGHKPTQEIGRVD